MLMVVVKMTKTTKKRFIVYILNLEAKIIQNNVFLPMCYVKKGKKGILKIDDSYYDSAIFVSLPIVYFFSQYDESTFMECFNEMLEHECVHEVIDWRHDLEEMVHCDNSNLKKWVN